MWYGQLSEEIDPSFMSAIKLIQEPCAPYVTCNVSSVNGTLLDHDRETAYRNAIEEFKSGLSTHGDVHSILLLLFYIPVFGMAFFCNSLVLAVVVMNRTMRNVTNLLLLNLAIADLCVSVVCVPIAIGQSMYKAWLYGEFMCKFTTFLQGTTVTASVFTISLLSVDRFLAIKKPVISRRVSAKKSALKAIGLIWVLSALPMIPLFLFRKVDELNLPPVTTIQFCHENWFSPTHRLVFDVSLCVIVYILPGIAITTSYVMIGRKLWYEDEDLQRRESEIGRGISRQVMSTRKRIAKMLIVLALLFTLCWLPYHIACLYLDVLHLNVFTATGERAAVTDALSVLPYTILLGHANSAINPLLYFYASRSFRRCVKKFLHCTVYYGANESPNQAVVKYSPMNSCVQIEQGKNPLVRLLSRNTVSTSRSTGSFRFSRSSLRSSRSSGSFRRQEQSKKPAVKPALLKLKEAGIYEKAPPFSKINLTHEPAAEPEGGHVNKDALTRHRRDMFSCTLSIPTTINEDSSRPTSPCLHREMPSAIPEEDGNAELTAWSGDHQGYVALWINPLLLEHQKQFNTDAENDRSEENLPVAITLPIPDCNERQYVSIQNSDYPEEIKATETINEQQTVPSSGCKESSFIPAIRITELQTNNQGEDEINESENFALSGYPCDSKTIIHVEDKATGLQSDQQ